MMKILFIILLLATSAAADTATTRTGQTSMSIATEPDPFQICDVLPDYQSMPDVIGTTYAVIAGADWKARIEPKQGNSVLNLTGHTLYAEFISDSTLIIPLPATITASAGYVDISVLPADTRHMQGGNAYILIVFENGASMGELYIPVTVIQTATRP